MTSSPQLSWKQSSTRRQAQVLPGEDVWHQRAPYCFYNRVWSTADCDDVFDYESLSLASGKAKDQSTRSISDDSAYEDPAYWRRNSEGGMSAERASRRVDTLDSHTDTATDTDISNTEEHKHSQLARIIIRFAERTSMQGVPYIRQATTVAGKLIWSVLFVVCLCLLAGHLFYLFAVFYSYPKHSTVELGFSPLHFPAVTFCNVNPVKRSRLDDMSSELKFLVRETEPDKIIVKLAEQAAESDLNSKRRKKRAAAPANGGGGNQNANPNKGSGNNNAGGNNRQGILRDVLKGIGNGNGNGKGNENENGNGNAKGNGNGNAQRKANASNGQGNRQDLGIGQDFGNGGTLNENTQGGSGSNKPNTLAPGNTQLEKPEHLRQIEDALSAGLESDGGGHERKSREITTTTPIPPIKRGGAGNQTGERNPFDPVDLESLIEKNSGAQNAEAKTPPPRETFPPELISDRNNSNNKKNDTDPNPSSNKDKVTPNKDASVIDTSIKDTSIMDTPVNDAPTKDASKKVRDTKDKKKNKGRQKQAVDVINDLDLGVKFTNAQRLKRLRKEEEKALRESNPEVAIPEDLFGEPSAMASLHSEFMYLYSNEVRSSRMEAGHQVEDMLVDCAFAGRRCHPQNFSLLTSSMFGNCFTIDYPGMLTTRSGYQGGLSLIVFLEGDEYLSGVTTSSGIQVIIHPHNTLPFPQEDGLAVMAGTETNIALRLLNINRLGWPHGVCQEGEVFRARYNHSYTRRACQHYCEQEKVMSRCKCYSEQTGENLHRLTSRQLGPCRIDDQLRCMLRVQTEFERGDVSCECDNPCTETSYTKTVSMRHWPADQYVGVLVEMLCTQKNATECEKYRRADARTIAKSFVKINIFYEDLNYENITEVEDYDIFQFASDVGGTVGLWLGLSILSGFEVLQFILELVVYFLTFGCCKTSCPKSPKRHNTRLHSRTALRMSDRTATGSGFSGY